MHEFRPGIGLDPDVQSASLIASCIGTRCYFSVSILAREPSFNIDRFSAGRVDIAGCKQNNAVGDAEALHDLFFDRDKQLMLTPRRTLGREDVHLDLLELMVAKNASSVLACCA